MTKAEVADRIEEAHSLLLNLREYNRMSAEDQEAVQRARDLLRDALDQ